MVVHVGLQIGDGDIDLVWELVTESDLALAGGRVGCGERNGQREQHGAERRA
jgi:hypothetical protein